MKKILFAALILVLGFAPHVLADGFTALAPIPGLTQSTTSIVDPTTLSTFLNNLYKYLVGLAAAIAVVQIIWAGLDIAFFHKDAVSTITDDKGKIYNAVFGLILVLSPVLVFSIINPSILNLTLNLPPITTLTTQPTAPGGTPGAPIADTTTGCSVTGTAGILQFADCPSTAAATAWGQQSCPTPGLLSAITTTTTSRTAGGTTSTNRISCTQSNVFEFIDVSTSRLTNAINSLQPVATTNLIPGDQNNGASAVQYAAICQSAGLNTCISDRPFASPLNRHTCAPLPTGSLPVGAPSHRDGGIDFANCYKETLSCENISFFNANKDMCAISPSWTPFN